MSDQRAQLARPEDTAFQALLDDLRQIIASGRGRVAAVIQAEMVQTYWQIGERIVGEEQQGQQRAAYGAHLLTRLGCSLEQEFGRAFTERNLRHMRQFYLAYPNRNALRSTLGWASYRVIMRLPAAQRPFYEQMAATGRWSSRELERQIGSLLYERVGLSRQPELLASTLPPPGDALASYQDTFRDPVLLDFLGLADTFSERDLEAAVVREIEDFSWL